MSLVHFKVIIIVSFVLLICFPWFPHSEYLLLKSGFPSNFVRSLSPAAASLAIDELKKGPFRDVLMD